MAFKKLNEFQRLKLKWTDYPAYRIYKSKLREAAFHELYNENPPVNIDHPFKAITHFKHSGNAGDIIYSLPAIYALSKKGKAHLHLQIDQPAEYHDKFHPLGNVMLHQKMVDLLTPLLLAQPQVEVCDTYKGGQLDYDLDIIRSIYPINHGLDKSSISRWYFHAFNIFSDLSKPWLTVDKIPDYSEHIIIARSHRYHAQNISYKFLEKYSKLLFVGVEEEYQEMKKQLPSIGFIKVKNFLELATVINSGRLFIGNQSFPFSLAEGLKTTRLLEVCYTAPNVIVEGPSGYDFCLQPHFEKAVAYLYDQSADFMF
jgi:hypothetical protein